MSPRKKLWKVTCGWTYGRKVDPASVVRVDSKVKAYDVHVPRAHNVKTHSHVQVWFDARDGLGWQLYETQQINGGPKA